MTKRWFGPAAALCLAGCGTQQLEVSTPSEEEVLAKTEHQLASRVKDAFGGEARIAHVLEVEDKVLVSVAAEGAPIDGDALPPVGVALYEARTDDLRVIAKELTYRSARVVRDGVALLATDGTLTVRDAAGSDRVVATGVRGDVVGLDDGRLALTAYSSPAAEEGETKVAIANASGDLQVLADGAGSDDRPAVSPDGKTVVFVSGRTGVASLYRTDLSGAEPVQLTNAGVEIGVEREGDPEGFVPPPINTERLTWVDADVVRYDAGGNEFWRVNVRTGEAVREGAQ